MNLLQDRINATRNGGPLGDGQEARDAGHQAHVGLGTDLSKTRSEILEIRTVEDLAGLETGTTTHRVLRHILLHVRITNQREKQRHLEEFRALLAEVRKRSENLDPTIYIIDYGNLVNVIVIVIF